MTDNANNEDVKIQDDVTPVEATENKPQEATNVNLDPQPGSKEYNWRRMEQKLQDLERKNQEMEKVISEAKQPTPKEEDELSTLQEDDIITVSQANKLAEQRAKKIVHEELSKRDREALPIKTRSMFEDYDQVVTNENINLLVQEDPDLEYDIQVSKNPFARAYKEIKNSKFYREHIKNKANVERIERNSEKPISSNTIAKQSPLSHANAFANYSKEELRKEMDRCARRAASVPNMR